MLRVKLRRSALAGLLAVFLAISASACMGMPNPQGWASPVVDGSSVYLFTRKDRLAAIDFDANGRATTRWTFPDRDNPNQKKIRLEAVYATPILDDGRLYIGSFKGEVMAVSTADGELAWRNAAINGSIVGDPVLAGDILLFGTTENRLYALNKSDGATAPGWPAGGFDTGAPVWAPPAVANGVAYFATMRGEVRAIRLADRSEAWSEPFKVPGAVASIALLDDTRLFVAGLNRSVNILDTATGKAVAPMFQASDWVWNTPAFNEGIAYFGDFAGKVYALDITTGQARWTYSAPHNKIRSGPIVIGDALVVVDRDPIVHFLDLKTGAALNTVPLIDSGTVRADPTPDAATALIVTTKGKLFRADPKTRSVPDIPLGGDGE
ncbi:hypothetical protein DCC78_10295 [bacterium]|nr:MAG: hypothetical protein DCC78_10295 [bacterium]